MTKIGRNILKAMSNSAMIDVQKDFRQKRLVKVYRKQLTDKKVLICLNCPKETGICHFDCKDDICKPTPGWKMVWPNTDSTITTASAPGKQNCIQMEQGICHHCSTKNKRECSWEDHIICHEHYVEHEE